MTTPTLLPDLPDTALAAWVAERLEVSSPTLPSAEDPAQPEPSDPEERPPDLRVREFLGAERRSA